MLGEWYLPPGKCQAISTITEGIISISHPAPLSSQTRIPQTSSPLVDKSQATQAALLQIRRSEPPSPLKRSILVMTPFLSLSRKMLEFLRPKSSERLRLSCSESQCRMRTAPQSSRVSSLQIAAAAGQDPELGAPGGHSCAVRECQKSAAHLEASNRVPNQQEDRRGINLQRISTD